MDYTQSDEEFAAAGAGASEVGRGARADLCGHWRTASNSPCRPIASWGRSIIARSLGAAGFSIFNFDHGTAASILPGVGLGVGRTPAVPPHRSEPAMRQEGGKVER